MTHRTGYSTTRRLILALVLLAYAWRIHKLGEQSLWRDEIDAIYFALRDLPDTLTMFVDTAQNGVLYFLGLRPWLSLVGSSEFALRYPSLLFGILSIPLFWQVCRKLAPAMRRRSRNPVGGTALVAYRRVWNGGFDWLNQGGAPLIAAALLAINPYHLWYSQEGKMYALITFLALLAIWFWLKGIERGGFGPWLGFLVTVSLAIYTHLLMILLIPLFFIWFLIAWPKSKRFWRGYFLALAGLTLPYLPLLWWQWEFLISSEKLTELPFVPLSDMFRTVLYYQSSSFFTNGNILFLVPIFGLALVALAAGLRFGRGSGAASLGEGRRLLMILAWLLLPILSIYLLSLRQPVFLPRYVIWIAPAAMMLLALGLQAIWQGQGRLARALAVSLLLYLCLYWGVIGWQEKNQQIKTDLRGAVTYLQQERQTDDLLIIQIPHLYIAYQYYSSNQGLKPFENGEERLGRWAPGLIIPGEPGAEAARELVDKQMHWLTIGAEDIWVLLSEVDIVDPDHLMVDWLDQQATLVSQVDFHGSPIRQYRFEMEIAQRPAN